MLDQIVIRIFLNMMLIQWKRLMYILQIMHTENMERLDMIINLNGYILLIFLIIKLSKELNITMDIYILLHLLIPVLMIINYIVLMRIGLQLLMFIMLSLIKMGLHLNILDNL